MDFLRLYLGEITGLVLVLALFFVAAAIASRYVANPRKVRTIRNICVTATIAAFIVSLIPAITVDLAPRGRVDRSGADRDQKAFEQRHSDRNK